MIGLGTMSLQTSEEHLPPSAVWLRVAAAPKTRPTTLAMVP